MTTMDVDAATTKPAEPAPAARQEDARDQGVNRSKKQVRKRGGKGGTLLAQEISVPDQHVDMVRLVRSERKAEADQDEGRVVLSKTGKATQLQLGEDKLSVTGHKGFRTVRATHGVHEGAWYCEFTLKHLGATGHARLGWVTKKAELQAPVGFDLHGFAYRDVNGDRVHEGRREAYGAPFKEGDVVGLLLHMPPGGRPIEARERKVVRFKGAMYYEDEPEPKPLPLPGSSVSFSVNGVHQGPAFHDIPEGTYYPAASIFTMPEQAEGASLVANFGPDFAFPPPAVEGMPPVQPMCAAVAAWESPADAAPAAAQQPQPMAMDAAGTAAQAVAAPPLPPS